MGRLGPGRWTADIDGDFVVFLIGFRLRPSPKALAAVRLLAEFPKMVADLAADPDKGLLAYRSLGLTSIQYWRSFEHLERFARNPDDRHAVVWREWYHRAQHLNAAVGIWHETYRVRAGDYEAIYQGMPAGFGLLGAGTARPLGGSVRAAQRMGVEESRIAAPDA